MCVLSATVLGLSSLISEHGFVHMGTMTTVSAGICDESVRDLREITK